MQSWLKAALGYIPSWLDHQVRVTRQPGCAIAIAHDGRVVLEHASGVASESTGARMTPQHRFRVASHSKTFTATAILALREAGRLTLDDPAGLHVEGLHPDVAAATLEQLLSHSAGLTRDGTNAGQWQDERPFLDERHLRAALAQPPVIPASSRFKYSNHAFGLLGLVIAAVSGETYRDFVRRIILEPMKLAGIAPDAPLPRGVPFVSGHGRPTPLDKRPIVPGDNPTHALASATGFVATAGDLVRFFASLDPQARRSVLSVASRREMIRRQWADPYSSLDLSYGLGVMRGEVDGWAWFGHGGAFQSGLSATRVVPGQGLAVSVLTNAIDGPAADWAGGVLHVLKAFAERGAPLARTRDWSGRWWGLWDTFDLVPFRERVLIAAPDLARPFDHVPEVEVIGRDTGVVALAGGFEIHGEPIALVRGRDGRVREVDAQGSRYLPETRFRAALRRRHGA